MMNYGHEHLPEAIGIQHGSEHGNSAAANTYTDKAVTFPKPFTEIETVLVSFKTDSTNKAMGGLSVSAIRWTTTGFTLRFFNNTSTSLSPPVAWIAIGKF